MLLRESSLLCVLLIVTRVFGGIARPNVAVRPWGSQLTSTLLDLLSRGGHSLLTSLVTVLSLPPGRRSLSPDPRPLARSSLAIAPLEGYSHQLLVLSLPCPFVLLVQLAALVQSYRSGRRVLALCCTPVQVHSQLCFFSLLGCVCASALPLSFHCHGLVGGAEVVSSGGCFCFSLLHYRIFVSPSYTGFAYVTLTFGSGRSRYRPRARGVFLASVC